MAANPLPQPGSRVAPLLHLAACVLSLVALVAIPAGAQIFKCSDNAGNVVYQNETCPKNTKATRVDIFDNSWTADRTEKDAAWQRQATAHRVVAGMPLHWVREALGEPIEVRNTATAARPAAVAGAKIVSAAGSFSRIESPLRAQALAAGGLRILMAVCTFSRTAW